MYQFKQAAALEDLNNLYSNVSHQLNDAQNDRFKKIIREIESIVESSIKQEKELCGLRRSNSNLKEKERARAIELGFDRAPVRHRKG